jgi:hypothetical protein
MTHRKLSSEVLVAAKAVNAKAKAKRTAEQSRSPKKSRHLFFYVMSAMAVSLIVGVWIGRLQTHTSSIVKEDGKSKKTLATSTRQPTTAPSKDVDQAPQSVEFWDDTPDEKMTTTSDSIESYLSTESGPPLIVNKTDSTTLSELVRNSAKSRGEKWIEARLKDDESYLDYVLEKEADLKKKAVSISVDPDYLPGTSLWTYTMRDGSIVLCQKGIVGGRLNLNCE